MELDSVKQAAWAMWEEVKMTEPFINHLYTVAKWMALAAKIQRRI